MRIELKTGRSNLDFEAFRADFFMAFQTLYRMARIVVNAMLDGARLSTLGGGAIFGKAGL